jgi:hypothetical protein
MRRLVLQFGFLSCVLLAGCSISQRYPGAWPRVDPTRIAGCPPVAGDYLSDGVRADPFAALSYLSGLVFERRVPQAIIRIAQYGTDSLAIVAWKDGQAVSRRVFSRAEGNLDCTREGVRLSCGWHSVLRVAIPVLSRRTLYLARATDGSLMVQDVEFSIALLTLLPFPYKSISWNRFSPPTFPPLPPPEGEPPMTE